MDSAIGIGSIVLSLAGRDKGGFFIVTDIVDANFVRIADGKKRHLESAKLKKLKHLRGTGDVLENIADKLKNGVKVHDAEIYSALRKYNT